MDSAIVSTALDNSKKFWKCDEENDEIDLLLDSIPELSSSLDLKKRIGHGAFSAVYLAHHKGTKKEPAGYPMAIKHIIPTSHPSRIFMELKCLKLMGGNDNIIELVSCLRNQNHIVMIMPYFPHDSFSEYVGKLSVAELRDYLQNLFIALKRVHKFNIIHRDVKPSNFLYSRKYKRYVLIDFGLAQEVSHVTETKKSFSCTPLTETPHLNPSRVVKRKLSIPIPSPESYSSFGGSPFQCAELGKFSPASLPSFSWQSQQILRRSPRKVQTPNTKSPHKENYCLTMSLSREISYSTPTTTILDSPSKHTRLAEAFKDVSESSKGENNFIGFTQTPKKTLKRKRDVLLQKNDPVTSKAKRVETSNIFGLSKHTSLQQVKTKSGQNLLCAASCNCYGTSRLCSVCLARKNQQAARAGTPGFRAPEVLMRHPHQTTAVDMWAAGVILLCLLSGRYPFFQAVDDLSSLSEITTLFGTQALKKAALKIEKIFLSSEVKPTLDLKKICEKLRTNSGLPKAHVATSQVCPSCRQVKPDCICKESPRQMAELPLDLSKNSSYGKMKSGPPAQTVQDASSQSPTTVGSNVSQAGYPDSAYHLLSRLLDLNPLTRISANDALNHPFMNFAPEGS